jgi:hypothetical protein
MFTLENVTVIFSVLVACCRYVLECGGRMPPIRTEPTTKEGELL